MKRRLLVLFMVILSFILVSCTEIDEASFSFKDSEVTIKVGDSYTLDHEITQGLEVEYTMSAEGIISISGQTVTALAVGEVDVTATVVGKDLSDTIKIIVEAKEDPVVAVQSVAIAGDNAGLVGEAITLTATVLPQNATNKEVTWTTSDAELATVENGVVTLLKAGVVTITATSGEKSDTHEITISDVVVDVESVTIEGLSDGVEGTTITLTVSVLPVDATDKTVTWTTSNAELATVANGVVTLLKEGVVTITSTSGEQSDTHEITINALVVNVDSVSVEGLNEGVVDGEITLTATVLPQNATNKEVTWTTSDAELATVVNGVVTLLKEGVVTITATADGKTDSFEITIGPKPIELESIEITGSSAGFIGDTINLTVTASPEGAQLPVVIWSVNISAYATVENGVVTLHRQGTVLVTATVNGISATHEITVQKVAAQIGSVNYGTIQDAITAASDSDTIVIFGGTHNEVLNITKSNLNFVPKENEQVILTNVINLTGNLENISFTNLEFTLDAQIKSTGTLKGFTFKNNLVYDTNLAGTTYAPISRINVNAFIQFYRLAGTNLFGDIHIEDNVFTNIKSDIISLDRTMVNAEINIKYNEFRNFEISAIRFDGGYNNGTYNITNNLFENDELGAYSAITFRAYAPESGNVQNIYIDDNTFVNIGTLSKNRDGDQPGSGVITFSTFNSNDTNVFVRNNEFTHTFNSIHLRGALTKWSATISGNTFTDSLGYIYFDTTKLAVFETNEFVDALGEAVDPTRVLEVIDPAYKLVRIAEPVLESFEISGFNAGQVSEELSLTLVATPPYFVFSDVVWTSSDEEVATVVDGVVTLLQEGVVTITATYGEMIETIEITVTAKMAAYLNEVGYVTIQEAITAAVSGDTIEVNKGEFSENLNIDKPLTLLGFDGHLTTLTGKVTIAKNIENVTIEGFNMTGNFQVISTGTLKGFSFRHNHVFDTNLIATGYATNARTNVNAIIQFYAGAGTNVFGDIHIEFNTFNNIKSDIIALDRTMASSEINIRSNEFTNFNIGAIRFDGGYNNGTYNIEDNIFKNDVKQAETAILFRAYSASSGNLQTINIQRNLFENIGNEFNNPTDNYAQSAVIATSTYNSMNIDFNIIENVFVNTHNTVHLRKNETTTTLIYDVDVLRNTFENPTGYVFFEDGDLTLLEDNIYLDKMGQAVDASKVQDELTGGRRIIKILQDEAEYVIIRYTFNAETATYDISEEFKTGVVGSKVTVLSNPELGYFTEFEVYEGVILADGSLVIEIYYEVLVNSFTYELEFNGGNTFYENRDAMVNDWINDYNTFGGTSYVINELPRDTFGSSINIHTFFFDARFRDKWLWVAKYLGVVGSSTNRASAQNIVSRDSVTAFDAVNANYRYAFSYEVRGFMDGRKFTENANWQSADYSLRDLKYGFWSYLIADKQETVFLSQSEVQVLPTEVYLENYEFKGWFNNPEFTGDRIYEITEPTKLYAKFEEKNPVTSLTISNPIGEMIKGDTYDLVVDIAPTDAYNKLLLFTSSDVKVMSVSPEGTLTALNAGIAVITVTNHNGEIMTTMEVTVHPMDDVTLEFSSGFNGFINVGEEFTMTAVGVGKDNAGKTFTYVPEEDGIVELIGTNTFKALLPGTTLIDIFDGAELIYTYTVVVQGALDAEDRVDQLLDLLGNANNAVVNGLNVITYYTSGQEWSDPRYESVNLYLFDDYVVDRTTYPADPTKFSNRLMDSVEFVLIHDTANLNGGLASHGSFFANPANSIGIHYTTGDYGIVSSLPDEYVGWHAGDGTASSFQWHDTGIVVTDNEKPIIDISTDGFWTFNGQKSTVQAPRGDNNAILDKSYFTYQGPTWDVVGGKYVIGTHWFAKTQQARGVIASRGGNLNSIGIEMNVNRNADIIDTVQRTAKLVANLLEENNLSNNRVIMHNTTDGKGDPYTLNNTVYNGTWYFDRFMEHVAIERLVLSQFADATITFHSDSELLSDTGRVIAMPQVTTEVQYTITVEIDGVSKSITLTSVIPGIHTWSQNYGFFKPTQAWAKADYRK
ncbi:Ig-like domain-containing protein [Acholeplasma laidlawii]|uniref:Ig-like domain-containing protein n=1 Tax=Acholeplasma laidlawii TaxID=2148 RepID=UPI000C1A6149|nr:Ig-like domain-containing protein [Acholeplasma laidlawii]PII03729.1 hypothetical protein B9P96_001315 [Acholeplasma laidlawii]